MMKKILLLVACLSVLSAYAQYSDEDVIAYIARYSAIAERSMKAYKIPASIKLAQAIYATNAGQSKIAKEANNHFGILCKKEYTGEKYYETSDRSGDCYRMYSTVEASYLDHDFFLTQRPRYADLFKLDIYDYKAWATGLQLCGYSPNPAYAQRLINIIEKYNLTRFDGTKPIREAAAVTETQVYSPATVESTPTTRSTQPKESTRKPATETPKPASTTQTPAPATPTSPAAPVAQATVAQTTTPATVPSQPETKNTTSETINGIEVIYNDTPSSSPKQEQKQVQEQKQEQVQEPAKPKIIKEPVMHTNVFKAKDLEYKVAYFPYTRRNVYENNKIKFVIAKEGDTYARIAYDVALSESSLRDYNDAYGEYEPVEGEVVYLQMKSTKAEVKFHVLSAGDTFRYLSQKYAVQLRTIIKRNPQPSNGFNVGDVICVDCK